MTFLSCYLNQARHFMITALRVSLWRSCLAVFGSLFALSAQAQQETKEITLSVSGAQFQQVPIAVGDFTPVNQTALPLAMEITDIIRQNLQHSGLMEVIAPSRYPADHALSHSAPDYTSWQQTGAQMLVLGNTEVTRSGNLRIEFILYDLNMKKELLALAYKTIPSNHRRLAHVISDVIYQRLASEKGSFDTRIVYIAETGAKDKRIKRLAVMDQDGGNQRYLTTGKQTVLTPRFSPNNAQEIVYLAYVNDLPRIYLLNIETGQQELLGDFEGQPSAPRYSPKGDAILLSLSRAGNTDLFEVDLISRRINRLTEHSEIDTSGSYSPDGQQIVFNSMRSGSPQLYVMNAQGSDAQRISFDKGSYLTPVWSPTGEWIAFIKQNGETFSLGIMRPDGSQERILSQGYMVDGPSWSPNGRSLIYFKSEPDQGGSLGRTQLYTIDLFTYRERMISTDGDASDPAWSPLSNN